MNTGLGLENCLQRRTEQFSQAQQGCNMVKKKGWHLLGSILCVWLMEGLGDTIDLSNGNIS